MIPNSLLWVVILMVLGACQSSPCVDSEISSLRFPQDWYGTWEGTLQMYALGQPSRQVPMQLEISPIANSQNELTWRISYGTGPEQQLRDYRLCTIDAASGLYLIDEGNSIQLQARLVEQQLSSHFEVDDRWVFSFTQHRGDHLTFGMFSGDRRNSQLTGKNAIQPLQTHPVLNVQQARLWKTSTTDRQPQQ